LDKIEHEYVFISGGCVHLISLHQILLHINLVFMKKILKFQKTIAGDKKRKNGKVKGRNRSSESKGNRT